MLGRASALLLIALVSLGYVSAQVCDYCRNQRARCHIHQADVAILLQSTESVSSTLFQSTTSFIANLLYSFSLGECTVRAALASFSAGSVTTQFDFNTFLDQDEIFFITSSLQKGVDEETLNLAVALDYVRQNIYVPDAGSRPGVPKILVVIVDNLETQQLEPSIADASNRLKEDGVIIFAVGIGPKVDPSLLKAIADEESRGFYFPDVFVLTGPLQRIAQSSICYDFDECEVNNGGCDDICVNTPGSFICACANGTVLSVNQRTCINATEASGMDEEMQMEEETEVETTVDYCGPSNGGCCQLCLPTPNGRNCSCHEGYILHPDGRSCVDVNECFHISTCSHLCFNTEGSFFCQCPEEYELADDMRTCVLRPGPADCPKDFKVVSHSCMIETNTSGSYDDAEDFCDRVHNDTRLAKVADDGTRALVTRFFPGKTWIGLRYVGGRWINSDGTPYTYEWAYAEPKIPGCGYVQNLVSSASCNEDYFGACEIPRTVGFAVFGRFWSSGTQGKLYMPTGINRVLVTFPKSVSRFQVWYASIERQVSVRQFIITQGDVQRLSNNGHVGFVLWFGRFYFPNYRIRVEPVETT